MTSPLVVIEADELDRRIEAAVRRALEGRAAQPAPEWLDAAGAAAVLGCHPRTIGKLAKTGALPGSRLGRLWRFRRADVDAYLAGHRTG